MSNDKEKEYRKKYGLLPPKIAESDILSLDHGLCGSGGSIYNKDTSQNTLSACTHNDRSSYQSLVGLKLSKPQISQRPATSTQDLFHNTWLARYPRPQFIVFDNGIEFKREFKQIGMQDNYGIKAKPTTSHNSQPTSNCNH
jgi:hypothetical protein